MPFIEVIEIGPDTVGGWLGDIDSHLPARHPFRDKDKVTWAHEATRGVNHRIRSENPEPNGYYLLRDLGFTLPASGVRLSDLARAVPTTKRGPYYNTYLEHDGRGDAFCVLDELHCFIHGALVGRQLDLIERYRGSFAMAEELYYYATVLKTLVGSEFEGLEELLTRASHSIDLLRPRMNYETKLEHGEENGHPYSI